MIPVQEQNRNIPIMTDVFGCTIEFVFIVDVQHEYFDVQLVEMSKHHNVGETRPHFVLPNVVLMKAADVVVVVANERQLDFGLEGIGGVFFGFVETLIEVKEVFTQFFVGFLDEIGDCLKKAISIGGVADTGETSVGCHSWFLMGKEKSV